LLTSIENRKTGASPDAKQRMKIRGQVPAIHEKDVDHDRQKKILSFDGQPFGGAKTRARVETRLSAGQTGEEKRTAATFQIRGKGVNARKYRDPNRGEPEKNTRRRYTVPYCVWKKEGSSHVS